MHLGVLAREPGPDREVLLRPLSHARAGHDRERGLEVVAHLMTAMT